MLLVVPGCHHETSKDRTGQHPEPTSAPAIVESGIETPLIAPVQPSTPVKVGPPPLVYLCPGGMHLRVVDAADHSTIVDQTVEQSGFLSLSGEKGASLGGVPISALPLQADHSYEIYVEPIDRSSSIRNSTFHPGPPPAPASQPLIKLK